jgi:hypothetical protein
MDPFDEVRREPLCLLWFTLNRGDWIRVFQFACQFMRKASILVMFILCAAFSSSCSPRDFLTRRLAADLIATSATFRAPQQFQLHAGVISNHDYLSPEYLALQHHGWISATSATCATPLAPPCWEVLLTPSGVDTVQSLIAPGDAEKQFFTIPAARREIVAIVAIAKQRNVADVEFTWRWIPLNEIGAAIYSGDVRYSSTVLFRRYDDGWHVIERSSRSSEPLDEALRNAEPAQ